MTACLELGVFAGVETRLAGCCSAGALVSAGTGGSVATGTSAVGGTQGGLRGRRGGDAKRALREDTLAPYPAGDFLLREWAAAGASVS